MPLMSNLAYVSSLYIAPYPSPHRPRQGRLCAAATAAAWRCCTPTNPTPRKYARAVGLSHTTCGPKGGPTHKTNKLMVCQNHDSQLVVDRDDVSACIAIHWPACWGPSSPARPGRDSRLGLFAQAPRMKWRGRRTSTPALLSPPSGGGANGWHMPADSLATLVHSETLRALCAGNPL